MIVIIVGGYLGKAVISSGLCAVKPSLRPPIIKCDSYIASQVMMVKIMRVRIRIELVKGLDADLSNLWPSLPPSLAQPHLANNIMIIFHDNLVQSVVDPRQSGADGFVMKI